MTTTHPELAESVRRLFEELIELPWDARRVRLAKTRADDPELALRVEALLTAADDAPEFLERPALESELVGHAAGPWILEERLSSGGGGDVYRARRADGDGWRVALKVLRRRAEAGEVVRRMQAERGALAALNHPFIVPLVDAGLIDDGRAYLATKLVEGLPLDRFAEPLDLERRLRLFLSVCAAVQHAHERLIAHCDLKPANVLVTPDGMPQLLDFGIARLLAGQGASERALTPGYASPEQIAGAPLGTASDVWSLGAVLHELVTGRRPVRGERGEIALASEVVLAGAEVPSALGPRERLARRLRGDLDALVAKALAQDPRERYGSVEQLARDLEGLLAGRPVSARPASRARRTWLFARRNRVAAAATLVALASLVFGGVALYREVLRSRAEASMGWRAHAQAALATRMLEDLARAAGKESREALLAALDSVSAELARETKLGPETEGRLRLALGALYVEAGRPAEASAHLVRARELAATTRGFGGEDRERIERLLREVEVESAER